MMKKLWLIVAIGFLFIAPTLAEAQADRILDRVWRELMSPLARLEGDQARDFA